MMNAGEVFGWAERALRHVWARAGRPTSKTRGLFISVTYLIPFALLLLALLGPIVFRGAGRHRRTLDNFRPGLAVAEVNRRAAVASLNRLREALNGGACQAIYEEAAEVFRDRLSRQDWMLRCEEIRASLGFWKNIEVRETQTWENFTVHVEADARFANGAYRLRTAWQLENGRAHLFTLDLDGDGRQIHIPSPWPGFPLRHADPQPHPPRAAPGSQPARPEGKSDGDLFAS
jgi:hypothetical protein